jgi:hypothetical protein
MWLRVSTNHLKWLSTRFTKNEQATYFFTKGANNMKIDTQNQSSENNSEVEKNPEQVSASAKDTVKPEQDWWRSVKYPDSACESDR